MKEITQKMINEFSKLYLPLSGLKIEKTGVKGCWELKLDNAFIKNAIISPSDIFYKKLEEYFNEYNYELAYNNTGDIFWAKNQD